MPIWVNIIIIYFATTLWSIVSIFVHKHLLLKYISNYMIDDDYMAYNLIHKKFRFIIGTHIKGKLILVPIINVLYSVYILLKTDRIAYEIFIEMKIILLQKLQEENQIKDS